MLDEHQNTKLSRCGSPSVTRRNNNVIITSVGSHGPVSQIQRATALRIERTDPWTGFSRREPVHETRCMCMEPDYNAKCV